MREPMRVRAKLLASEEQWEEAAQQLDELLVLAREGPYPYDEGCALYEYGRVESSCGDGRQARAYWRKALTIFRRLGATAYVQKTQEHLKACDSRQAGSCFP
jgi:tetratricopeptide (TPR) repeat protein